MRVQRGVWKIGNNELLMSNVTAVVSKAGRVKSLHTTDEKLDQLAAAIEELARFLDRAQNTIAKTVRSTAARGR
jgi:hypothetical protein